MKCPKCGCESFIVESDILVTEKYKIYKNGRVSDHPISKEICREDMAEYDNLVRCNNCKTAYSIHYKGRDDLLYKTDFSKVNLEEAEQTKY